MRLFLPRIGSALGSLAGRMIVILALGLMLAVSASLLIAEQVRLRDLDQLRRANLVGSVATAIEGLREHRNDTVRLIEGGKMPGIRVAGSTSSAGTPDIEAERLLAARIGAAAHPRVVRTPAAQCGRPRDAALEAADLPPLDCWQVSLDLAGSKRTTLIADLPLIHVYQSAFLDPIYLALLGAIGLVLAVLVTRSTIAPLRRLTEAARSFSAAADPTDIPVQGPREVRLALRTFNLMQQRVRDGVRERTHILAAVSHDLQTPLTRMRLRVEKIDEPGLRAALIDDLAAMQRLVGEGLDLARSTETNEPWSLVNIDSLLATLADDMTELGAPVTLNGCESRARISVRLEALTRVVQNLIDNAIKYGGDAELGSSASDDAVIITVRDHGPGIPENDLLAAFEPFTRLPFNRNDGHGGTGLGLTIARAQAATFGATVSLANSEERGLIATVRIPAKTDT